jgi:citrate lyase beta subunit
MNKSLTPEALQEIGERLEQAHALFQKRYPGDRGGRRPVHVVYGGAQLFRAGTARKLGELALRSLDEFAPNFLVFAKALGLPGADQLVHRLEESPDAIASIAQHVGSAPEAVRGESRAAWFAHAVYQRVREKLLREAVEDFRIDFEDGYGNRTDDEEDSHAIAAAGEVAQGMAAGDLPPFIGIRIKPLTEELRHRSIRTLDIFLTELAAKTTGQLPGEFRVTLPKVTMPDEVAALADICSRLETTLQIASGALHIELMIETTQALLNERGEVNLLPLVVAARGRCLSVHFGPYDYTASRGLVASSHLLSHFASDFAREVMQVALARTGVGLADGPTNIMPIPPHRAAKEGPPLSEWQREENSAVVHRAWKLHFDHVRRSLSNGFYQGWDLHPAQLPSRYAAVFSFFLENADSAAERLRNFIEKAAQATRVGQVFDDAAMAQGLLNYFLRAIDCGAITPNEAEAMTSLSVSELRTASFVKILQGRSK